MKGKEEGGYTRGETKRKEKGGKLTGNIVSIQPQIMARFKARNPEARYDLKRTYYYWMFDTDRPKRDSEIINIAVDRKAPTKQSRVPVCGNPKAEFSTKGKEAKDEAKERRKRGGKEAKEKAKEGKIGRVARKDAQKRK
eukprot:Phypoly_transcript_23335.p1 GENE.Phypoly_transcript_23335~~Phypoly_transcript_23335.p1  ORF type:complete len:139 (+),score=35.85 Phypoly_transcript_23335:86-502(+)